MAPNGYKKPYDGLRNVYRNGQAYITSFVLIVYSGIKLTNLEVTEYSFRLIYLIFGQSRKLKTR